ncbi:uncharacterized protein BO80DRAFT_37904 [Aspergillus ibericus CBS 121593]|uniref:Uncharacterized protein n=1 Tax=Aspergillus ibericus CBS 121593 TaxID=1448316 RepID=A0A395H337_9EURO|nr:hypothetical protein BO80DRAFT_37904 [Aspergillus ibericus CBS 121593]RAL02063.1 hypothetical protein BO80DRAFT_37904 [Aspergillus ibericus CBS 121593]
MVHTYTARSPGHDLTSQIKSMSLPIRRLLSSCPHFLTKQPSVHLPEKLRGLEDKHEKKSIISKEKKKKQRNKKENTVAAEVGDRQYIGEEKLGHQTKKKKSL